MIPEIKLGSEVTLQSGEKGTVIGHAFYLEAQPSYLVRYVAADGRLTECWWGEAAINSAPKAA